MKSKKIVALIVAFAAFMAVATSGLAAISTTTTYSSDKVSVTAVVDAEAGKEVTYLVKNNADPAVIVYIDQQTADENGKATFEYKIATSKISGLATTVSLGTDGSVEVDSAGNTDKNLKFGTVTVSGDNITVVGYYSDPECNSEAENKLGNDPDQYIYVKIVPVSGYNITDATGGDDATVAPTQAVVKCGMGDTVTVTTENVVSEPEINDWTAEITWNETANDGKTKEDVGVPGAEVEQGKINGKDAVAKTTFFKVTGKPAGDFGVKYGNEYYKALGADGQPASGEGYYAVRIIIDGTTVNDSDFEVFGY